MIPKKKIIVLAGAGLVLVMSAAGVVYKLNGSEADPGGTSGATVDSIAASNESDPSGAASDLAIPVEGEEVVQDVSVPNPQGKLVPGMYARVSLDARRFADRILVPRSSILERDRRKMLFVFEPGEEGATRGFAKWRYVTTGLENDDSSKSWRTTTRRWSVPARWC